MYRIVNISATFQTKSPLDLSYLKSVVQEAKYNPKVFSGFIKRFLDDKFTATMFQNGNVVLTGTTSLLRTNIAARKVKNFLNMFNIDVEIHELKIQNMVGSGNIGRAINLENLYSAMRRDIFGLNTLPSLEPELFPGLICRFKEKRWSTTIFRSGKYIITGCKEENDILFVENCIRDYIVAIK